MSVKKFFVAILFAALVSVNTCFAMELVTSTAPDSDSWLLAIMKEGNEYIFVVFNNQTEQGAVIPYDRNFYNFYLGESPLIFVMAVHDSPRDVDVDLGEWADEFHLVPVYALFNYKNGKVTLDSYLSSGAGLNPSHYQGRIQSPYHIKLAEVFLTRMPDLHKAVESNGVVLP